MGSARISLQIGARVLFLIVGLLTGSTLAGTKEAFCNDPLSELVTIYRDEYGVPHIVGDTEPAVFFGYGYAQAEDHLEAMMVQYRDAQGRLAEIKGAGALGSEYLRFNPREYRWAGDYLQRLLRTKKCVVENKAKIDPVIYSILDAFARGVNAYIESHRDEIPAWIDSIAAEDVEALERSQYFRFYSVHDALSKLKKLPREFPGLGSNQWGIAPSKSADGRIMHVEDVHMPWSNRFQNYEAHLIVPGKLDAGGISWFGSPFFLAGFNDHITWSITYNVPNISDVYEETLNPEDSLQYRYDGKWLPVKVEHETARIKTELGMETRALTFYYTHHGPIVQYDRDSHRAYSVKLPNFDGVNYSLGLYSLMKAQNLAQFKAALARQLIPRWNFLYSDSSNIFWVHNGLVAQRSEDYDWASPVPGSTSKTEWGPFIPFEKYPQALNPASGFLQNCNNPYWVCTRNSGISPLGPAPYYLTHQPKASAGEEVLNPRGERVFQILSQNRKFAVDDMIDLGFDTHIVAADVIVPLLLEAGKNLPSAVADPRVARALDVLRTWDLSSSVESPAFSYIYFWGKAYQELFSGGNRLTRWWYGDRFARFNSVARKKIDIHSRSEQKQAMEALVAAINRMEKCFKRAEVPWGDINVVDRGGTFPLGGADTMYDPLHIDEGQEGADGKIHCDDGWGHLMIVKEGAPKQIWSLLPYGESENPKSPHFNDQAKLHSQRRVKRFWFSPAEIVQHTVSTWGDPDRLKELVVKRN